MKTIFTIVIAALLNMAAVTFTFANNADSIRDAPATTENFVTIRNDKVAMSAQMNAILENLIANNTMTVSFTTIENATIVTITIGNEIIVSNSFVLHIFNEITTSDKLTPAAAEKEVITLDAEEL